MRQIQQTEEKQIGEFTYIVRKLLAREGVRLGVRVGGLLAPVLAGLSASGGDFEGAISEAIGELFKKPGLADEIDQLVILMAQVSEIAWTEDGEDRQLALSKTNVFDTHFQDRYDVLIEWLVFALTVNLRSFFAGASGLGAMLRSGKAKPTTPVASSQSLSPVERTG